jgi:hypothetical protein
MSQEEAIRAVDAGSLHDIEPVDWFELEVGGYVLTYRALCPDWTETRIAVFDPKGRPRMDLILGNDWRDHL